MNDLDDFKRFLLYAKELFTYGICNFVTSFFSGFPGCVAISRCIIADDIGARTQIYGLVSSLIVLAVILFFGSLFRTLPNVTTRSFD